MGFFGSLFGLDKNAAALNAVLASHLIERADQNTRKKIATEVVRIVSSVQKKSTLSLILRELSSESRAVQANFIALACDNLGIPVPINGNFWTRVQNPYMADSQVDEHRITAAIDAIDYERGVRLLWPGNEKTIDFESMYRAGELAAESQSPQLTSSHSFSPVLDAAAMPPLPTQSLPSDADIKSAVSGLALVGWTAQHDGMKWTLNKMGETHFAYTRQDLIRFFENCKPR